MSAQQSTHWADIQHKTFTRWCNQFLKERGMHVEELEHGFKDGIKLCNLIEIISNNKSVGRINKHPRVIQQKLENVGIALQFLAKEDIKLVNIGPEDIVDGNLKLILGLIWTLILRYQINIGLSAEDDDLLKWVQSKIPEYGITNFTKDWNDGKAICGLVNALRPGYIPNHRELNSNDAVNNAKKGIDTAWDRMDVAALILPDEMTNPRVDKLAMMTYISQFRNLHDDTPEVDDALHCQAYGPGLTEGVQNQLSEFTVDTPGRGKLEVKVEGPSTKAEPSIKSDGNGRYQVSYTPEVPGTWKVHVTLDGKHIPGSIFTVTVLEDESLGGEGKFRVFFSTTAGSQKGRTDVFALQTLLEAKKIHERPDFEPWIPVDIMDREDREAVFRKSNTRALPIVIIDDVVVGDYDAVVALNESGTLDKILKAGISGAGKQYLMDKAMFGGGAAVSGSAAPAPKAAPKLGVASPKTSAPSGGAKPKAVCMRCGKPNTNMGSFCAGCGNSLV